jgi:hypothetical protein
MPRFRLLVGVVALLMLPAVARSADERVILITIDGLRWQEVFAGAEEKLLDERAGGVRDLEGLKKRYWRDTPEARRRALMPFLWTVIAKQGQIFGDPSRNARAKLLNGKKFSYPGYNEILCGFADDRIDSNDKIPNPNVNVLEWLSTRSGFSGRVSAYATWDVVPFILNAERSKLRVVSGWERLNDPPLTEEERQINRLLPDLPLIWPNNVFDLVTARGALEHLRKRKPRVLYIGFGETDEWAHYRRYDCYLDAANKNDAFLKELWERLQSMPEYAGRTSLIITTDHGRGSTKQDWTDHGKDTPGAEYIWTAVLGPRTPALGVRENVETTQGQFAATVAALVGEDFRAASPNSAPPLPGAVTTNGDASRPTNLSR